MSFEVKRKVFAGTALTLFLMTMVFSVISAQVPAQYAGTVKIGIVGPKGLIQWDGLWEGAQMARDIINNAGGVNIGGVFYNIQLVDIDEGLAGVPWPSDPIAELLVKLEENPDMQFLIGGFRSECVFPMREAAMDYAGVKGRPIWFIVGAATDELIDCGDGTCGACVRCNYDRYKYMFRVSPVNATTLLNTLVAFLRDHVLPQELAPIYGSPVKTYIVAENLVWCDGVVASLQAGALGTRAEIVGVARPSPIETDFGPQLDAIEDSGSKLIIHMFSAGAGESFIEQWGKRKFAAVPVGINVGSMTRSCRVMDWMWTGEEYESILHCVGTRTNINPGAKPLSTEAFWDEYLAKYKHDPIYPAWGVYEVMMALAETLGNPALVPTWPMTCDQLIPIIEQTDRTGILGNFKYTQYHDVFCNELGSTWTQGYARPLVVQWQDDKMEVVWPQDKPYSGNYKIPPWMYIFNYTFDVVLYDMRYPVFILSNSVVSNFNFNKTEMQISFNVAEESGTTGYCNVTIPKSLMTGNPWTIKIDNTTIADFDEETNGTHTFLHFAYTHESPLQVAIEGTWVVPEFPSLIILPLFMIATLLAVIVYRRKRTM